jgi:hypothetical protein
MSAFLLKAKFDGDQTIEIEHVKYQPGTGWITKTDFVYSYPLGDWDAITFDESERVSYTDFLRTMVYQNVEVWRKMATLALEAYYDEEPEKKFFAIVAIELLDPTFEAPTINLNCRWQCELVDHVLTRCAIHVISTSRSKYKLKKFFYELQSKAR